MNRFSTCAWIDTSSAATDFVADEELGLDRERARDADARALAAGELVRVAAHQRRVEPDAIEHAVADVLDLLPRRDRGRARRGASPTMSTTRMRGLSDAYGSWKIICILQLLRRALAPASSAASDASAPVALAAGQRQQAGGDAAERRLAAARFADQADDLAGRDARGRRRRPRARPPRARSAPSALPIFAARSSDLHEALATRRAARPAASAASAARCRSARQRSCTQRMEAAQRRAAPAVRRVTSAATRAIAHRRARQRARNAQPGGRSSSDGVMPGICAQARAARVAARHRIEQARACRDARAGQDVVGACPARRCGPRTSRRRGRRARRRPRGRA